MKKFQPLPPEKPKGPPSQTIPSGCMLVILLLFIACICTRCSAQRSDADSLCMLRVTEQQAISYISMNLRSSFKVQQTGYLLTGAGTVLISGAYIFKPAEDWTIGTAGAGCVGAFCVLLGFINIIDAHSYIGNAGRVRMTPDGLVVILSKKQQKEFKK